VKQPGPTAFAAPFCGLPRRDRASAGLRARALYGAFQPIFRRNNMQEDAVRGGGPSPVANASRRSRRRSMRPGRRRVLPSTAIASAKAR
jgi:hypothetical protein